MTENDYIAEYVKEKHPGLLGFNYIMWKLPKILVNAFSDLGKALRESSPEEIRQFYEEHGIEVDEDELPKAAADIKEFTQTAESLTFEEIKEIKDEYSKKLWQNHETVLSDDMIEIGLAEELLNNLLLEHGVYDDEI